MLTGMARGKWPFGGTTPQPASDAAQPPPALFPSADAKKWGLENFGNTCYANSVIQALYFCAPFRDLLIQVQDTSLVTEVAPPPPAPILAPIAPVRRKPERKPSTSDPNGVLLHPPIPGIPPSPPSLFSALRSLFVYISTNPAEKGTVAPRAFIDKLKEFNELFRSTMHQDAHEFLNYLLNKMIEDIEEDRKSAESRTATLPDGGEDTLSDATAASKNPPTIATTNSGTSPQNATLVHRIFEGVLTSETRCLTCENVSSRDESFLDLSIDIEQNASVTACLRQFSASEMLCQKNKFFCDVCCDLQEAEKRMKIKKLPNVLALHLKRFKYQEDLQKYIKLTYRVAFPFELRLFNTVDDIDDADRLFNLFGIVVHIGNGPHHGHYISIIKTMGSWLVFDDDNVYPIAEAEIPKYFGESNSGSAYVLFFQAVDVDLQALGLRPSPAPIPGDEVDYTSHVESSPSAVNPLLPPGLVDGGDLSDTSESAIPATPPSSSDSRPPLDVTILTQPEETLSHSLPTKASRFFKRTPSTSARSNASNNPDPRRSIADRPLSMVTADVDTKPLIPPPAVPPPLPTLPQAATSNGKEKETSREKKASSWFGKRKSFRIGEKVRSDAVDDTPPSPVLSTLAPETVSQTSSSTWFLSSGHVQNKKSRRPSEPGLFDNSSESQTDFPTAIRPKSSGGGGLSVKSEQNDKVNGYDSPSPASASSSSVSVARSTAASVAPQQSSVEFPPTRTSSLASQPLPLPPLPPPVPEPPPISILTPTRRSHKKSTSNLSSPKKAKAKGPPAVEAPPRPSTAGSVPSAAEASMSRPLPPIPPLKDYVVVPPPPPPDADDLPAGALRPSLDIGKGGTDGDDEPYDPLSDKPTSSGLDAFAGASNSSSSTSTNGGRRPSRKMSLSSPLLGLGFGKKDRQKDDKEKSPSSFRFGKA